MDMSQYSSDNKGDYKGALSTRLRSLTNGINGLVFTTDEIPAEELFDKNVIIDLSRVGSSETKSLIMGLLVMKLQEHRIATCDGMNVDLNHVTVLEEAHNLLKLSLIHIYGTQLSTNDDAALLHYVADQIKKGGKQVRDRFLFVINKMDQFNPQEESIEKAILSAKRYLASYGIDDPQLFPCSAFTALKMCIRDRSDA